MNTGLDENQTELGITVLSVSLQVLANGNSLLDELVQVLGDLGSETVALENTENLVTSDGTDLGNAMEISENDTDLRGSQTLLGQLADLVNDFLGRGLEPRGRRATVGESRGGNSLARCVHAAHLSSSSSKDLGVSLSCLTRRQLRSLDRKLVSL